jgi:hypothetical protein
MVKKVVLSYRVSSKRNTLSTIRAIVNVPQKLLPNPDDLTFVFESNSIYRSQHFFAQYVHSSNRVEHKGH